MSYWHQIKSIMIDKTIKNIKKYFNTLKRILTAKISEKKYFTRF